MTALHLTAKAVGFLASNIYNFIYKCKKPMVTYNPDNATTILYESNKLVGGFDLTKEEWFEADPNTEGIVDTPDKIFRGENAENYNLYKSNSPVSITDLPTSILLFYVPDQSNSIIPVYVESDLVPTIYRGRENYESISRENSPVEFEESTVSLSTGEKEISSSLGDPERELKLYLNTSEEPIAYIPLTYTNSLEIIPIDSSEPIRVRGLYVAPDAYLCELCGWTAEYLVKTV